MTGLTSQALPEPGTPPLLPVATLKDLHGVADDISGLFCKIDNITRALGGLTNRFEDDRDESAADYLLGEIEDIITSADGKLCEITKALAPYREGKSDE